MMDLPVNEAGLVPVRCLWNFLESNNLAGDICGFPPRIAEDAIRKGAARLLTPEEVAEEAAKSAPPAAKESKASTKKGDKSADAS